MSFAHAHLVLGLLQMVGSVWFAAPPTLLQTTQDATQPVTSDGGVSQDGASQTDAQKTTAADSNVRSFEQVPLAPSETPVFDASQILYQDGAVPRGGKSNQVQEGSQGKPERAKGDVSQDVLQTMFQLGLQRFHEKKHEESAHLLWKYLESGEKAAANAGWAQYFLAESLLAQGFVHAAQSYYFVVAKSRTQPEVIQDSLARLEQLSQSYPIDLTLIEQELLDTYDVGAITPELKAWIHFVQGKRGLQDGYLAWAHRHLQWIPPSSPYFPESLYVLAVQALRDHEDKLAEQYLSQVVAHPLVSPERKNMAKTAQARMLFEQKNYDQAALLYEETRQDALGFAEAEILTEIAWNAYYRQDYQKGLGYLQALSAPSYGYFFFPEFYLLKSLMLRSVCHYLEAKHIVRQFRTFYGFTLDQMQQRMDARKIDKIRKATLLQGPVAKQTKLLRSLNKERQMLTARGSFGSKNLSSHLFRLYDGLLHKHDRIWQQLFDQESEQVMLRLLQTRDQIDILDYEMSLDIYRPIPAAASFVLPQAIVYPSTIDHIFYAFDGEYWNDEMMNYQVFLDNRCVVVED